jgi:hypothetical protein
MPGEIANNYVPKETKSPQDLDDKIKNIKDVLSGEKSMDPRQYAVAGKEASVLTDADDKKDYRGGSYGDLKEEGYGWPEHEVHHMPADSASELPREDGPAIVMDYADHRQTASCGLSKEAAEYRQTQRDLIAEGKFMEAQQMDIDDIHEKFGDKYDNAIAEALEYAKKLKEEGRV